MQTIEPLADQRKAQQKCFQKYEATPLSDAVADHAIMTMFREEIINVQRIATVVEKWDNPDMFNWGDRTAYRLFNAATYALEGRVTENPTVTARLHNIIDDVCAHH